MPSTIHLRRKIKSVTNTRQITKAMQMVSASKMRRAQEAVTNARAYAELGQCLLANLQAAMGKDQSSHPLFRAREVKRTALVVMTSDKGLAGAFNTNILKLAFQFLNQQKGKPVEIITVGRKGQEAFQRFGAKPTASFTDLPTRPTSTDIRPVAKLITEGFLSGHYDRVELIYTEFHSTLKQVATQRQILPFPSTDQKMSEPANQNTRELDNQTTRKPANYTFEPDPTTVLNGILPRLVETQFLQASLDSIASEHSARMLAMKNATDNASQLIGDLRLTYNSVRQATITAEIAEISAGANALADR